jgi:hypothetical protein
VFAFFNRINLPLETVFAPEKLLSRLVYARRSGNQRQTRRQSLQKKFHTSQRAGVVEKRRTPESTKTNKSENAALMHDNHSTILIAGAGKKDRRKQAAS